MNILLVSHGGLSAGVAEAYHMFSPGADYVPSGELHACGKGAIAYEVQQATNVTFRFYDYDRVDADGNKRELHLDQAISFLKYDPELNVERYETSVEAYGGCVRTVYCDNDSFKIEKLQIDDGTYRLEEDTYELVSVVRGEGTVNGESVKVGSHFLAPKDCPVDIAGTLTCMMTPA